MISSIIFILCFGAISVIFSKRIMQIRKSILQGKAEPQHGSAKERITQMILFALGQKKMLRFKVAGFLHIIVYVGFVIVNIEFLEIVIDGAFATHRVFSFFGELYNVLIHSFELLAALVIIACVIFLIRRNILSIQRFRSSDLKGFPFSDANIILTIEIALMSAFLLMNAADLFLQHRGVSGYAEAKMGTNFFSYNLLYSSLKGLHTSTLIMIERVCWWFHILGIFGFILYIPYSKHLHIFLSFPNSYFAPMDVLGKSSVSNEVKTVVQGFMNPEAEETPAPERFGAKDVADLSWIDLLGAYSCTECGRCTASCPANQTGKMLSPRKIMMDTRDRLEDIAKGKNEKELLYGYIQPEEIMACTTCNACVEACPVLIRPLAIIMKLRQHIIMDESKGPNTWVTMCSNIENNGAPWQFSQQDRDKWTKEIS